MQNKFLTRRFTSLVALALSAVMALSPVVTHAGELTGSVSGGDGTVSVEESSVSQGNNSASSSDGTVSGDLEETLSENSLKKIFPDQYLAIAVASYLGIYDLTKEVSQADLDRVWGINVDTVLDWSGVERLSNLQYVHVYPTAEYDVSNLVGLSNVPNDLSLYIYTWDEASGQRIKVHGDIAFFANLPNLVRLSIASGSYITGELSSISCLNKLIYLGIHGHDSSVEGITGTLADLSGLTNLEGLSLYYSNITGTLSDISSLNSLSEISFVSEGIGGDFSELSSLVNLSYIYLNGSKYSGSLESFRNMTLLYTLHLNGNMTVNLNGLLDISSLYEVIIFCGKLEGNLDSLAALPSLHRLSLVELNNYEDNVSPLTCDISIFKGCSNLYNLYLGNLPGLSGDIAELSSLTNLQNLNLYGTGISGSVEDMASLENLSYVNLFDKSITGDISAFSGMPMLTTLNLAGSGVTGDISSFPEMPALEELSLGNTEVYGNIIGLQNAANLKYLHLQNTDVSGDIGGLASLDALSSLTLSNTQVNGNLSSLGAKTKLSYLDIQGSSIRIEPEDANLFPGFVNDYWGYFTEPHLYFFSNLTYCKSSNMKIIQFCTNKFSSGLVGIEIDGNTLDASNYYYYDYCYNSIEDISYKELNLTVEYLETLEAGSHDFVLDYYWGGKLSGSFTIEEPIYHTVIFQDYDGSEISSQQVADGGWAIAPENPVRSGYIFRGWDKEWWNVTSDITITAVYSSNSFAVYFQDWNGTFLKVQEVIYGEDAVPPEDPVREGFTFIGWDASYTGITQSLIITALYESIEPTLEYTVTFKNWDGGILEAQMVEDGQAASAPAENPTRTGYTFIGWDKDFSYITGDTTITAQYSQNEYTVTFNNWDGTMLHSAAILYGEAASAPVNPTRDGYTFTGWDKDFTKITNDLTVTAQYEISQYTVTFKSWDGKTLKTSTIVHGENAVAPDAPARTGYVFTGWNVDFTNIVENLVVTALYKANTYTVTFKDHNGSVLDEQKVDYGKPAKAPEVPSRPGYTFSNWDKGFAYITEDLVVTAEYKVNTNISYVIDEPGEYNGETLTGNGNIIIRAEKVSIKGGIFDGNIYVEAKGVTLMDMSVRGSVFLSATGATVKNSVINGSLTATASGIELENLNISGNVSIGATNTSVLGGWIGGNLTIERTVADGNVTIKGVVARKSILTVKGGGSNSIIIVDTELGAIIVDKPSDAGSQPVRVVAQGSTVVANTIVNSPAIIEDTADGDGMQSVTLGKNIPAGATIELRGSFNNVTVEAPGITVVNNATVNNLNIEETATQIRVEGNGEVDHVVDLTPEGQGPTFITGDVNSSSARFVWTPSTPDELYRFAFKSTEPIAYKLASAAGYHVDIKGEVQGSKFFDAVEIVLGRFQIGRTYNIYLDGQKMVDFVKPIRIVIDIPKDLRRENREFIMIGVDKYGVPCILKDLDLDPNTITFSMEASYAYALCYNDPE